MAIIHNDASKGATPQIPRSKDLGATGQNNDAIVDATYILLTV